MINFQYILLKFDTSDSSYINTILNVYSTRLRSLKCDSDNKNQTPTADVPFLYSSVA